MGRLWSRQVQILGPYLSGCGIWSLRLLRARAHGCDLICVKCGPGGSPRQMVAAGAAGAWLSPSLTGIVTAGPEGPSFAGRAWGQGWLGDRVTPLPGGKHGACCLWREERGQRYMAKGTAGARGPRRIPRATPCPLPPRISLWSTSSSPSIREGLEV